MNNSICTQLMEIGLTALEADIYLYLLTQGTQTGYAVSKGINKPTANVYKSLESLVQKGAIELTVSNKKQYIACDWKQLIARQKTEFDNNVLALEKNLSELELNLQDDEQVFQLSNPEQVLEHSKLIINNAQSKLMVDADPLAVPLLKSDLKKAVERGVEVWIKVYEPVELAGANVICRQFGSEIYGKTKDISFRLAADGQSMLIADLSIDKKRVIQAFRSNSALMSLNIYNGLLYEIVLTELKQLLPNGELNKANLLLSQTAHLHPFSSENEVFQHFQEKYQTKRESSS